jgi:hypothetical protein
MLLPDDSRLEYAVFERSPVRSSRLPAFMLKIGSYVVERLHRGALVAFALLAGLLEGPAEAAAILVLVTTVATGRLKGFRPGLVELGIAVWMLAGVPGLLMDPGRHSSAEVTRPLFAVMMLVGARAVGPADDPLLRKMAWAFAGACVINAAYGLVQYVVGPLPWDPIFMKNPDSPQLYIPNFVYHVRAASGLYYNRLKLAHVGMVGAILIAMIVSAPEVRRRVRAIAGAGGIILAAGLAFTYARLAVVAVILAFVALALVKKRWWVVGAALLVAIGGAVAFRERLNTLDEDLAIRRQMFEAAVSIFRTHPIFGVGHGVYRNALVAIGPGALTGVHLTSPHNLQLQLLAETGVVGFLGFHVAIAACLVRAIRRVSRERGMLDRLALLGVLAILFVGLLHFSLHHAPVGLVFWTLAGVCVRSEGHGEARQA